jgi:hypothetical protein
MCPPQACTGGLMFGTTYFANRFAKDPPLTEEQIAAEKAMLAMTTKEFWSQIARENGVTDLEAVDHVRRLTLTDLQMTLRLVQS